MTRRIASPGPQASQSLSRRPPFLEDFPIRSTKAAKYSPIRARKNPCATGIGTVFSQTLTRLALKNLRWNTARKAATEGEEGFQTAEYAEHAEGNADANRQKGTQKQKSKR